uniref:Sorcin-like n=1 Tax=Nelumbo nucifera TaxID=4432 RepID=A0A822XKU7_NELNU|nr:TPA_asm: hypothetical protein HUJ06_019631 [Nelumbo nucifera]
MENMTILKEYLWFKLVDSDKTRSIIAPYLKRMTRTYDFDRNGTMSIEEFVPFNKFLLKVQQAFSDLERGQGFLVDDDVYEALIKVGFSLDSLAFYTVCESLYQKKNGRFRLDDFIALCIFLQFVYYMGCQL